MNEMHNGMKGSKPIINNEGMGPGAVKLEPGEPIKFTDLPAIAAKLAAAEGTPEFDKLNQEYCGPDTGVVYFDDTKACGVAEGFMIKDGVIVRV